MCCVSTSGPFNLMTLNILCVTCCAPCLDFSPQLFRTNYELYELLGKTSETLWNFIMRWFFFSERTSYIVLKAHNHVWRATNVSSRSRLEILTSRLGLVWAGEANVSISSRSHLGLQLLRLMPSLVCEIRVWVSEKQRKQTPFRRAAK